ncbi:MAG: hypothetical protein RIS52_1294 [Pseudomonadota bacterium]|jgi:uncharacterized protein YacL
MRFPKSSLEDPTYAGYAWGRYKRLLIWMAFASIAAAIIGLWVVQLLSGPIGWIPIAMILCAIFITVMLMAALMGLVFLSHGSGHDDVIEDPFPESEAE